MHHTMDPNNDAAHLLSHTTPQPRLEDDRAVADALEGQQAAHQQIGSALNK